MGEAEETVRRKELCDIARLARILDRTNDMLLFVNTLAKMCTELNVEENGLLFIAYKTIFSEKYATLHRICVMFEQEDDPKRVECLVFYLKWLEEDMEAICRTTLDVFNHLLPSCNVKANTTLYKKIKGDACWFLYMLNKEEDKELLACEVFAACVDASKATEGMSPVHPEQLALHPTKTAFYHDVMKRDKRSIDLGMKALKEGHGAVQKFPSLDEGFYEQRAEIVKLMGGNLKLRMSDPKIKGPGPDENTLEPSLKTAPSSYSKGSPSSPAVIPRSIGPPMVPEVFKSPGDWSYQEHERNNLKEIMSRKKAAQPSRKDKVEGETDAEADAIASASREGLAFVASISQNLGHSSVMLETINMLAELNLKFTPEERGLLSTIYKEVFSKKYKDLRTVSVSEEDHVQAYRWVLEDEMEITCRNVLNILQNHLLRFCCGSQEDDVVLYTKMVGDINWFLAMLSKVQNKELHEKNTLKAYWDASKAAVGLSPAHPQRLALDLTMAAFYNDVMKRDKIAIDLGKAALDAARPLLNSLDEESRKDSAEIVKLLDENLKLWIEDEAADEENDSLEPSWLDTSAPSLKSSFAATSSRGRGATLQRYRHLLQLFLQDQSIL